MEYFLCLALILITYLIFKLGQMEDRLRGMKNTLNQIATQVGVPEDPVNEDLRKLLKEGKDVEAVKEARKAFGFSLLEAKQYVDALKFEND